MEASKLFIKQFQKVSFTNIFRELRHILLSRQLYWGHLWIASMWITKNTQGSSKLSGRALGYYRLCP